MDETSEKEIHRKGLKEIFWEKLELSSKSRLFKLYFFTVIIAYSGLSVFIPLFYALFHRKDENIIAVFQSLTTYSIVITGTAFADLIISMDEKDDKKPKLVSLKEALICMLLVFFAVFALTIWTFFEVSWLISIPLVILGASISLLTWWVANADNAKLADDNTYADDLKNSIEIETKEAETKIVTSDNKKL